MFKKATKPYRKIIFVSPQKIGENSTNFLNCYFSNKILILIHQTKYLHVGNQIYFTRAVFTWSYLLYKSKEDSYRPKYTLIFLLCPNRNDSRTFKTSSCKKNVSPDATCFVRQMFFVPCDNWKTLYFLNVCRYFEIFQPPCCCFL